MNQQIVINNQLIGFIKEGNELAEQTLLFLHGWRSNKEAWNGVVSKLISGCSLNRHVKIFNEVCVRHIFMRRRARKKLAKMQAFFFEDEMVEYVYESADCN
jgi:hypothetical protein